MEISCRVYKARRPRESPLLTDQLSIRRILDYLGRCPPPQPLPAPELLRVAEYGEGWGVPAEWGE